LASTCVGRQASLLSGFVKQGVPLVSAYVQGPLGAVIEVTNLFDVIGWLCHGHAAGCRPRHTHFKTATGGGSCRDGSAVREGAIRLCQVAAQCAAEVVEPEFGDRLRWNKESVLKHQRGTGRGDEVVNQ
jgi:hypothetical protein